MTDKFARELSTAWKTGGILFNTPDGPVYWNFDVGRMAFVAGGCADAGIIPEVALPYDKSLELCEHLERLADKTRRHYEKRNNT